MKFNIIHKEWKDEIILNLSTNQLYRININDETGDFILDANRLFIKWHKWGEEIFISSDNYKFYYCEKIDIINNEWEDTCYIDNINNIIYRGSNNNTGTINYENDELIINWNSRIINEEVSDKIHLTPINELYFNNDKIPNIIHFIYGFKEQKEDFELYRYIAIKSAFDVNKPDKIYFYYYYEPKGYWWNKIKPLLTLEKIEPPNEIFGNKIYHYAHQADIIRIQKLIEHGGIYLDIDTICLKSFTDLLDYDFVMGLQNNSDDTEVYGLCNAVILSKPNSFFANKWLETYKTFRSKGRDDTWDEHSVLKPYELSKLYSKDIKILSSKAFFYPLWYDINDILFNTNYSIDNYKNIIKDNYCIHLWDTYSSTYLKSLNEEYIFNNNTLYNIFSRKFLKNKISILFLTYNRYEKTKSCLESFLKILDRDDIEEFIILDNNSNRDLTDYLTEFQDNNDKVKLIFSNENLGVCGGRIILFKEAIGDIIISLDSDTFLLNEGFIDKIKFHLYNEGFGLIGISGSYINNWDFGSQYDINDEDENEYLVDHIAGCCQAFRRDLFIFDVCLDKYYGKFWVEDTDLSMQSLNLNKKNFRINPKKYLEHHWGGSGKAYKELFKSNWEYFVNKWRGKVLLDIK